MSRAAAFRGQPLLLLAGLLAAWLGLRAALWQSPFPPLPQTGLLGRSAPSFRAPQAPWAPFPTTQASGAGDIPRLIPMRRLLSANSAAFVPIVPMLVVEDSADTVGLAPTAPQIPLRSRVQAVVGHNLLLAAGLSQMELPGFLLAYLQGQTAPAGIPAAAPPALVVAPDPPAAPSASHWSADGWLLLRQDTAPGFASDRPSYGRGQVGAVVRYALAPDSGHRPQAYLRASAAVSGPHERELAAGLSARPLPGVPLRVAAEARVSATRQRSELRPAAYAVSEFPPLRLPLGARGEAYLQAGYVGGRYATAFVDGQGRIERPVARWGETELVAGAGAWGGAQKGVARLDIGPTAAVAFRLGTARGRVAADYRFRIAGEAEPASGPALTVSAGF